ncbi:MAG: hypothetical protein IJE10_04765 [Clostridia bacterium]|nr:hypothetical protein [Clostridia bacterium]
MKLSKQIIATLLILSMLLITMPVFAEEAETVNTRTYANTALTLPEDGSSVSLTNTYCGSANGFSLVLDSESARTLGIDLSKITSTISVAANSEYAGILLSGEMVMTNWTYKPNATNGSPDYSVNQVLKTKQATYFEFEDIEVSHVRKTSAGALVLEMPVSTLRATATDIKVYAGDVDFDSITENTVIEKVEQNADALNSTNFTPHSGAYVVQNLTAKAGENYWSEKTTDLGTFPADTKFFATSQKNLQYFDADYGYTADWNKSTEYGMNFYTGASNSFDASMSGPFTLATPNFSGEYYVYGLRKDCSNGGPRLARFNISGQKFAFKDMSVVTWSSSDATWSSAGAYFWDKAEDTVTFEAGKPYFFQNCGGGSSRLVAVAFVPVKAEGFEAPAAIANEDNLKSTSMLEIFTDEDFVLNPVETYTVKVDGADFTVKPYYHQVHTAAADGVYDFTQNVFGEPVEFATVAEVVALAKEVTVEEATTNYQISVNGVREYAPDVMVAMPGDVITVGTDAMTVQNFNPINLQGKMYRIINASPYLRAGIHKSYIPSYLYDMETKPAVTGTPFMQAKFAGYMVWSAADDYNGQKVYFYNVAPETATNTSDYSTLFAHLRNYSAGKNVFSTMEVETPEGTKTVMDPHKVKVDDSKVTVGSTGLLANYDTANLYWVNSSATNDVRVVEVNGKKVIRTDGCALIRVITKKADGTTTTERVDLTPKNMYVIDPAVGETVYVWKDTPWDGYSLIPITEPVTAE